MVRFFDYVNVRQIKMMGGEMVNQERLQQLRKKYGKRDGSTYYPEPEVSEYWQRKVKPFVRPRKFWHCLVGAYHVVVLGKSCWELACACPGTCLTEGFCFLTNWGWVSDYSYWRDHRG